MAAKKTTAKPRKKPSRSEPLDVDMEGAVDTGGPSNAPVVESDDADLAEDLPDASTDTEEASLSIGGGAATLPPVDVQDFPSELHDDADSDGDVGEGGAAPEFAIEDFDHAVVVDTDAVDSPPDSQNAGSAPLIDPEGLLEDEEVELA